MKKKLLSIITSLSLIASALATGVYAAPSVAGTHESSVDYVPIPDEVISEDISDESASLMSNGPSVVTVSDSAVETNTEFGTPEFFEGASLFADLAGEGTKESPYLIGSAEDLILFANNVNSGIGASAHYKLTADIDLGGAEWIPAGYVVSTNDYSRSFSGVFDGDGHTVSNFVISKADTAYVGFFGHIRAGEVKNFNIDNAVINFDSSSTQKTYVGILAGRVVTTEADTSVAITSCDVTNSSINASGKGPMYAGGIAGVAISGSYNNSDIFIAFSDAECDISLSSKATGYYYNTLTGKSEINMIIAGGIVGYLSAQTSSSINVINSSAKGDISAETLDVKQAQPLVGGAFGDFRTVDISGAGGAITVSYCYSEGTVLSQSGFYAYVAGGFAGQIYATNKLFINDCYSSSDVSGKYLMAGQTVEDPLLGNKKVAYDPSAGGFVGQLFYPNYTSSNANSIRRCYGAGDVVDLTHTEDMPKDTSFVGGFMAWSDVGIFENCYRFEDQHLWGSDCNYTDYGFIKCLSSDEAKLLDKYENFDFSLIWEMNSESEYLYPTLKEKIGYVTFVSDGIVFAKTSFGVDGKVSEPEFNPKKEDTIDKEFKFNYWSLTEDGAIFNFGGDTLNKSTTLYAVFKSSPRSYNITFKIGEETFGSAMSVKYGEKVTLPNETPSKDDTDQTYFVFLYWSETEAGEEFNFSEYTVDGDKTFYAVFKEVDKSAWTGGIAESFSYGFGTEALPYIIETSDQFALFAKVINEQLEGYTDAYYALGANINLGDNIWIPIGNSKDAPYSANFDGRGFTVGHFTVANNQYAGLFGYIFNGTVKNLCISDFSLDFSPASTVEKYNVYVGGVAGCIESQRGISEISNVRVSDAIININASVGGYLYLGNIAGYAAAYSQGSTLVHDCFSTNNIEVSNEIGYNHIGGIIGRFDTGSQGTALISSCYYTGTITSTSFHSSFAGGLVGYLYSYGKSYVSSGSTSSDDDYDSSESNDAQLAAEDVDIMIEHSFAVPKIYSTSTKYRSIAGPIAGEINSHAAVKNVYYPDARVIISPVPDETKTVVGTEVGLGDVMDKDFLTKYCCFDFENVWTYVSGYEYPVLLCMVADKSEFKVTGSSFQDNTLNVTVQVFSDAEQYSVILCVYNARNQIIGIHRENYSNAAEFGISIDNLEKASYYSVSVINKMTLCPLFDSIKVEL